jgi:hypothetical protein
MHLSSCREMLTTKTEGLSLPVGSDQMYVLVRIRAGATATTGRARSEMPAWRSFASPQIYRSADD